MTDGFEIQGRLTVDKSEVDAALQEVGATAGEKLPAAKLDVDTSPAWGKLTQLDTLQSKVMTNFNKKTTIDIEPKGGKDTEKAFKRIADMAQHMDQVKIRPEIQSMEISDTAKKVMELSRQWDDLNAKPDVTLGAKVVGGGLVAPKATGGDLKDLARGFRTGSRYSPMYAGAGLLEGASLGGMLGIGAGIAGAGIVGGGVVAKKLVGSSEDERKLTQFTTKTMGGGASVDAAKRLSEETGFLASDFMNAALAGKGLKDTYGMQTEQVANLVKVSADLAAESPYKDLQTVTDAMGEMKSALGGDATAAERLGITLGDNYMKTSAFGGVLKSTWDTLDEAAQYQYRYKEMLLQTQAVLGASKDETDVSTQMRKLNAEFANLKVAVGDELVPAMADLIAVVNEVVDLIPPGAPKVAAKVVGASLTPFKVGAESIPKNWLDVANLPNTLIQMPAQMIGQAVGRTAEAILPGGPIKVEVTNTVVDGTKGGVQARQTSSSSYAPSAH